MKIDTRYSLAPYCEIRQLGDVVHLGFGSVGMKFDKPSEKLLLFNLLDALRSPLMLSTFLEAEDRDPRYASMLSSLVDNRLLVESDSIPAYNRHQREQFYFLLSGGVPLEVSNRLRHKTVVIVGAGGIGCLAAYTLLTAGVGHLIIMDDDLVELHNISRQFAYDESDIGKKKVTLLEEQLRNRDSTASVTALDCRATFDVADYNIPACDFVLLAADEPGILPKANSALVLRSVPFIHVSYINDIAAWGPLVIPGHTGCTACKNHIGIGESVESPKWTEIMQEINGRYKCPIVSGVSTTAVGLASLDMLRYLGNFAEPQSINKRIGLWTHDLHFEYQDFSRSSDCEICAASSPR